MFTGKFPYYKNQNKNKMKITFVKRKNLLAPNEENWFHTEIDGIYVGDSGSHDETKAKEMFFKIVANGGVTKAYEILEEQIIE